MNTNRPDHAPGFGTANRAVVSRSAARWRRAILVVVAAAAGGVFGMLCIGRLQAGRGRLAPPQSPVERPTNRVNSDSGAFSPAHPSITAAVGDFFESYPTPVQPIAFNHSIHLAKGMKCTACHAGVTKGADAGIPSVKFCMACHQVIATSNPQIQKLAAFAAKGQDVPWQRVYWFYPSAHVRFWHAPHIRAGVDCSACHGDMRTQTVAIRAKNINMQFCLGCHRAKGVSVDCSTCHY